MGFVPSILPEAGHFVLGLISFFLLGLKALVMENIAIKQQKIKIKKKEGRILQAMILFVLLLTMTLSNLSLK